MQDSGKPVLRIALGVSILPHGISKLRRGLEPIRQPVVAHGLPGFVADGVLVGEVLALVLLLLGFHARVGALPVAVDMPFAFGLVHVTRLGQLNEQGGRVLELQGMCLPCALALPGPGRCAIHQRWALRELIAGGDPPGQSPG